jgi:quinoprotein glucose dehydrogenase
LWDYDVPAQPTLVDVGGTPALIQATKQGRLFLLDRRTGRPLHPVREQAVPKGGVAGERVSSTQPITDSLPAFAGPPLTEARMWGVTPLDQLWCRIAFRQARYEGPFTPPGLHPTIEMPGFMGAINWGGVSIDPRRGVAYVNSMRLPTWHRLIPRAEADAMGLRVAGTRGARPMPGFRAQGGVPYAIEAHGFLSPLGVPCSAPPYGMLTAVDLKTGRRLWERPLGTARDSGPLGIRSNLPIEMGLPNLGGSIVTGGDLLFIAAAQEQSIRAVDTATGTTLWTGRLPAGGQATPMTYRSPISGRQFVVVAAGGKNLLKTKLGDYLVAFALPRRSREAESKDGSILASPPLRSTK